MELKIQYSEQASGNFLVAREAAALLNRIELEAKAAAEAAQKTSAAVRVIGTLEKQLLDLQARQRKEAWDRLSIDQKIVVLKERAAKLDAAAQRAQAGSNRAQQIALRQQLNNAEMMAYERARSSDRRSAWMNFLPAGVATRWETIQSMRAAGSFAGGTVIGLSAAALYGIYHATKSAVEDAGQINRLANRVGTTRSEAQALRYGAGRSGIPIESMMDMLDDLRRNQGVAMGGDKSALDAFAAMKITFRDISSMGLVDLFRKLADEFERGGRNSIQYAAAASLLGRQFKEFAPNIGGVGKGMGEFGPTEIPTGELTALSELGAAAKAGWNKLTARAARGNASIGAGLVNWGRRAEYVFKAVTGTLSPEDDMLLAKISSVSDGIDISDDRVKEMQGLLDQKRAARRSARTFDDGLAEQEDALRRAGGRSDMTMPVTADRLARIGLFRGGANPGQAVLERQLSTQQQMVTEIRRLNLVMEADWPVQ